MRYIKYSILGLLLLLVVGIGIALLAPALVVRPILANYLSATGFELSAFDGLSISHERTVIARIALGNSSMQLTAMDTELTYSLSELIGGKLSAIAIQSLEVELLPATTATQAATAAVATRPLSDQINATLQTLNNLPLANLSIDAIDVHSADTSLDVVLQIDTQPLLIAGTVASSQFPDMLLQINASAESGSGVITSQVSVLQNRQAVMQADFNATFVADGLQLVTDVALDLDALQMLAPAYPALAALSPATETLNLALQITATDLSTAPALTLVDLVLDSPDHTLQFSHSAGQRQSAIQLQLPLQWVGAMATLEQPLQLTTDSVQATIAVADDGMLVQSEIVLVDTRLDCTLALECSASLHLSAQVPLLRTDSIVAQNLTLTTALSVNSGTNGFTVSVPELDLHTSDESLLLVSADTSLQFVLAANALLLSCDPTLVCAGSGGFDFHVPQVDNATLRSSNTRAQGTFTLGYSADGLDITLPATEIAVPALTIDDSTMSVTFAVSDFVAHTGTTTSASLALATQQLDSGLADIQLRNPSITGNMAYADDTLRTDLNLALANQLQAVVTAEFSTLTQAGKLGWEIPTYYFSSITPLSALITQTLLKADIVAGSIAGSGALDIAADASGNWHLTGPIALNLNDISGFVADTVFVGLNSTVLAALTEAGSIQSKELLSARIATLDVGLPLTDIRWNYSFDSAVQNITVRDLAINTLGGEITMADFSYDIQDPDSQLIVVLTNLNLQSIVDLAQYPGIRVEGLISGYLPLTLKGQTLTVEKGLIGALQPGGTIRYTSGDPVSSGNASLDLVNQALANYHYQIMNAYVYYNDNGDLRLEVQLLGNNPDLYNGQMVNLNVNIDDNIPTLLRSLQASRTITDALELRLRNRRPNTGNPGL